MKHFRFLPIVLAAALLLTAVSMPTSAHRGDKEGGYGSIGTFTKEMTHQGLDGGSMISDTLRNGIAVLKKLAVDGTTDVKTAQNALGALGLTFEEITKEMYRTVLKIG